MRNIKNNIDISDFDDFLCKLEEKEEFGCFIIRCWKVFDERCTSVACKVNIECRYECRYEVTSEQHTVDEQDNEYELDIDDEQEDEYELDADDEQNDEYELDIDDDQNDEYELDADDEQNDEHESEE